MAGCICSNASGDAGIILWTARPPASALKSFNKMSTWELINRCGVPIFDSLNGAWKVRHCQWHCCCLNASTKVQLSENYSSLMLQSRCFIALPCKTGGKGPWIAVQVNMGWHVKGAGLPELPSANDVWSNLAFVAQHSAVSSHMLCYSMLCYAMLRIVQMPRACWMVVICTASYQWQPHAVVPISLRMPMAYCSAAISEQGCIWDRDKRVSQSSFLSLCQLRVQSPYCQIGGLTPLLPF